jgi:hydrogenase maturation protease
MKRSITPIAIPAGESHGGRALFNKEGGRAGELPEGPEQLPAAAGARATGRVKVVGVGSPHGDDQAAWRLVESLSELGPDAICLGDPTGILDHLDDCRRLILVDACRSGAAGGAIRRLSWPDPSIGTSAGSSSHGLDVAAVLTLAENLGRLPGVVTLYVIEAAHCGPNQGLSPAVVDALPELRRMIRREMNGDR